MGRMQGAENIGTEQRVNGKWQRPVGKERGMQRRVQVAVHRAESRLKEYWAKGRSRKAAAGDRAEGRSWGQEADSRLLGTGAETGNSWQVAVGKGRN